VRKDIEFNADGVTLRGWFYPPKGRKKGRAPTVVMAHGFTALKEMTLDRYAEVFSDGGLGVLVYDNRTLGTSDGEPRHDIDPAAQRRDYRYALTFAETLPQVDPKRLGIWGTSYTGGAVLAVAALDRRVRAVVSQVPFVNGLANIQQFLRLSEIPDFVAMLDADRKRRMQGLPSEYVQVCADDPSVPHAFPGLRTYNYFHKYVKEVPKMRRENKVTIRSLEYLLEYDVTGYMDRISPTPLMMIVSENDSATPTDLAIGMFDRARDPKELMVVKADHYASYLEAFDSTSAAARDFFLKHL
jgi:fermentation-respiration switch protein FrsA (DUF1100 family)